MSFQITSAKAFGNGEGRGWIQVHDFTPSDESKLSLRGRLFAVISGKGIVMEKGQEVDKVLAGREVLMRLHEEYYGKVDSSAFFALKNAASEVYKEFKKESESIEIAVVAYQDDVVYSAVTEGSFVSLFRKGVLVKILEGAQDKVTSASGYPELGDTLVVGSSDFKQNVSQQILKQALFKKSLSETAEMIVPSIRLLEDGSRSGAVFIQFNEMDSEESVSTTTLPKAFQEKPKYIPSGETEEKEERYLRRQTLGKKLFSKFPKRNIRIKGKEIDEAVSKRRKVAVSVGAILIALLLVSIFFGIRAKKEKDKRALFEDTISGATHQLEEAISLYDLNPIRSRELFNQSKRKVESLLGEGIDYPEVYELRDKISENESKILGEFRFDPELFLDLTLLSEGFFGSLLSASEDLMVVLDSQNKRLVSIEIDSKRTEIVAGDDELGNPKKTAVYAGRFFVLDGDTVYEIDGKDKETIEGGFGGDDLISSFAGNIYVLSKKDSQIWRIAGSKDGFSEKSEWLSEGVEPDFSDTVSWGIDGNIWVLTRKGEILRYSLGNELNFDIEGVFPPVDSGSSIFTDEDSEFIYLLEPAENRIVVSDKEGEYVAQYISDDLSEGKSIIASENEKKLIVLTGEKLLSIELKHLGN